MSVQGSRNIEANTNDEVIQSGERILPMDVPKTPVSLLGRRTRAGDASRIRAYLKEFINAKEEKNNRTERWKRDYAKTLVKNLNKLTAFQCQQLFNDIQMDSTMTNKAVFWKDVPQGIKDRHKARLESIAERVHIRLTECIDHWVADACLRKYYERNYNSLAKKALRRKREGNFLHFPGKISDSAI
ncbi:hypothetical protein G6F56_013205 [Rhizopus delemar]|nr:hypothetical protein G6F56_013205 [Rhizopus delemar]